MKTGKHSREDELELDDEPAEDALQDDAMTWDEEGVAAAPRGRSGKKPKERPPEEDAEVRDKKRRDRERKRQRDRDGDWE